VREIIPFDFEGNNVRVIDRDGEPWFVLADVCRVLGHTNPTVAAERLDDDERATLNNGEGRPGHGAQSFTIVSESGLYALILTSRKPAAKRFRKWVTAEVLPSIRKTGAYVGANSALAAEVERLKAALAALTSAAALAKADEFRPARVLEDGLMVREIVARLHLPPSVNRRSFSGRLTARLMNHFAASGHPVHVRAGQRFFPRVAAVELAHSWRTEIARLAERDQRQGILQLIQRP
jgi:prophage antirepressor-like protein